MKCTFNSHLVKLRDAKRTLIEAIKAGNDQIHLIDNHLNQHLRSRHLWQPAQFSCEFPESRTEFTESDNTEYSAAPGF